MPHLNKRWVSFKISYCGIQNCQIPHVSVFIYCSFKQVHLTNSVHKIQEAVNVPCWQWHYKALLICILLFFLIFKLSISIYLFSICLFVCLFNETWSLHSPGYPDTYYIDRAGLEITDVHLPLPLKYWE